MVLEILEVPGNPSSVDQDSALIALLIQMSVERCNNFNSFLSIQELLNLDLSGVIENTFDSDLLKGVISFNIVYISFSPKELTTVAGSDIYCCLTQE
jgi:hypothetical protein